MDTVFDLLKEDNAHILALLGTLEDTKATDSKRRIDLLAQLGHSVQAHQRAADATFVPILTHESAPPPDELDAWHGVSREIDGLFDDLDRIPAEDDQFLRDVKVLHERIEERVHLEEKVLLHALDRVVTTDDAERLADRARAELG